MLIITRVTGKLLMIYWCPKGAAFTLIADGEFQPFSEALWARS